MDRGIQGELLANGLVFNKLNKDAKPLLSKADTNLPWTKALQRRMEREEGKLIADTVRQSGIKTADFMLRPGEGRDFIGKALTTCTGYATSIMLKAISNTLPTKQNLHRWYPSEHVSAACDLCGEGDETVAHLMLACPKLRDSTTAAHDKIRRRISTTLEKALARYADR